METEEQKEQAERIDKILEHIQGVQRNCYKLGKAMIKNGEVEFGRNLIANGQIHDNSKFKGIEFKHLIGGSSFLKEVIEHHQTANPHHPEYWGSIHDMPNVYIAEMVCDCVARANEFGTSARTWFEVTHPKKYNYDSLDKVGVKIQTYLNCLLEPSFK